MAATPLPTGEERLREVEDGAIGFEWPVITTTGEEHTLFDNVISPLLDPVCILLRKEREREIRNLAEHDTQRQNELSCYQHSQNSVEDMLRKNVGFKDAPPYKLLERDIRRLLDRMDAGTTQNIYPAS